MKMWFHYLLTMPKKQHAQFRYESTITVARNKGGTKALIDCFVPLRLAT